MADELISKKELLELYKISYGALYRWKRNGLIPEEWFIKKATVTGHETFFPKSLICQRIEIIKKQKDENSLKEISKSFSKKSTEAKSVVIDTVLGKKRFYLNEINSVIIDLGNGNEIDITDMILGGKNEH